MAGNPLDIGTEDARKSLSQNLVDIYAGATPAGGAFNAKEIQTDGKHASLSKAGNTSFQSAQFTPQGFKTKQSGEEFNGKALNWADGHYGHSDRKYGDRSQLIK